MERGDEGGGGEKRGKEGPSLFFISITWGVE